MTEQQTGDPYKEKFRVDTDPELDKQVDDALAGLSLDQLMATDKPKDQTDKPDGQAAHPAGGNIRRGKVVSIGKDDVFVDFGGKSQGVCSLLQFTEVKLGDEFDFTVDRYDESEGLLLLNRKGVLTNMEKHPHSTMIEAEITTRGLIGMEIDVVNATSGRGVMSHLFKEYGPYAGEVLTRLTGTIIATEAGTTTSYALEAVQERGKLFVGPGEEVYEGMIVGENPRNEDISCNAVRAKALTNFRSQGSGVATGLTPATRLSLERSIEYIASDEFAEVTPKNIRLRKRILKSTERRKNDRKG